MFGAKQAELNVWEKADAFKRELTEMDNHY
jgi:hypothetical protein